MHVKPNLQAKPITKKDGVNMKTFEVIIFSVEKRKELEKAEYDYGEDHEHIIALGRTEKEAEQSAIKAFRRERPSETPEVVETTEITEDHRDDMDSATLYADENGKELPRQVGQKHHRI